MEWYYDVFRTLALVIAWAIPAVLLVAVAVFIILAPAFTSAGGVLRVYEVVRDKLRRRAQAKRQSLTNMPAVQERGAADDDRTRVAAESHAAEKELVGTKS